MDQRASQVYKSLFMSPGNLEIARAILNATNIPPSEKRKALKDLGANVGYLPHQGKREMARRLSKIQHDRLS